MARAEGLRPGERADIAGGEVEGARIQRAANEFRGREAGGGGGEELTSGHHRGVSDGRRIELRRPRGYSYSATVHSVAPLLLMATSERVAVPPSVAAGVTTMA